ncbi:hypothetical protein niasHS_011732 [Heterodera schachtii]|uniref:Uncharacterized protein n=1 Tax=Heterodera schachtii TaxID=97005 RepID=A0ABD2I6J1_HETSC
MISELDKKSECKNKQVYCVCDPLHFDQMIRGICCDKSTTCSCCSSDPTIKERPILVRDPAGGTACGNQKIAYEVKNQAFCIWSEGLKASDCCSENYALADVDPRYRDHKIQAIQGITRHHPLCRGRLPWIHPMVCALDWYWVRNKHEYGK